MLAVLSTPRKLLRKAMAVGAIMGLTACDPSMMAAPSGGSGPSVDTSAPVPVALLIPRSDSGAGAVAASLENAARLAIASLDGVQIDLRVYDTGGDAQRAAVQAETAVSEGAKIILGPLFGEAANAAGVAVSDNNVNVLSFSNNPSIAGGNVYVLGPTFRNTANRLLRYASGQGNSSVVIVHPQNVEGEFGKAAIQAAASQSGVRVTGIESFPFSQEGVASAVPRIKSTIDSTGADSVFLTSNAAGALPILLQLLPEAGVSPSTTQYLGLARWDVPAQILSMPGAQGGYFTLPDTAAKTAFESRYKAQFGQDPHPLAGLAFDGIAAIGALVRQGRSDALSGRALTQNSGFQGANGVFRLRPDGTNERGLAVATVRNNQVIILDPAPSGFGGAGF
ncbi:penicillin-binding protein activator [Marivita geojedonensis]|uniref:ABC transporter substrate-binding protein n=1 Tax=Marivita geojedonensis TaxID=1123756 RepID=A0A1X4NP55_9RHOB|nr:penicillin-binding protein activator [Marivita geojedonensis]OSQ52517.1 ABC transporter substrate-binding protein [Marivita geojedonensis]PRY80698.1 amino acid/amide ABC transporter substrate-binding protein (HAAT family) [Marivita geojedonensis]